MRCLVKGKTITRKTEKLRARLESIINVLRNGKEIDAHNQLRIKTFNFKWMAFCQLPMCMQKKIYDKITIGYVVTHAHALKTQKCA